MDILSRASHALLVAVAALVSDRAGVRHPGARLVHFLAHHGIRASCVEIHRQGVIAFHIVDGLH